jgi:hypothetical protein
MQEFITIFLIWLIPASIELSIGALCVWIARPKPQIPSRIAGMETDNLKDETQCPDGQPNN